MNQCVALRCEPANRAFAEHMDVLPRRESTVCACHAIWSCLASSAATEVKVPIRFELSGVHSMQRRRSRNSMPFSSGRVLIKVAPKDSAKAWALLVRHSPGMALPDRTFLVAPQAVQALRRAGVRFLVISTDSAVLSPTGAIAGERI